MVMKAWSIWDANNFRHGDSDRDNKDDQGICLQQQQHSSADRDIQNAFFNLECLQDRPPFPFKHTLRSKSHCQSCIICQSWVVTTYVIVLIHVAFFCDLRYGDQTRTSQITNHKFVFVNHKHKNRYDTAPLLQLKLQWRCDLLGEVDLAHQDWQRTDALELPEFRAELEQPEEQNK